MSPIFPIRFCCQCAGAWVSWKIGKVEKGKGLNHRKQDCNKKGCVGKFTEIQLSHAQHRHIQNPVKHLRWSLLRTLLIIFAKSSNFGAVYIVENFSRGWNFNSLNRDEISSRISFHFIKRQQCKNRITIICENFITVNWAKISSRFEQAELKLSFHVNELKIIM